MKRRWTPALASFLALVLGFATADLTNIRWLGGLVLLVFSACAAVVMLQLSGVSRVIVMLLVLVVTFAISHPLGAILGSYGSLFLVSTIAGLLIYLLTPSSARA